MTYKQKKIGRKGLIKAYEGVGYEFGKMIGRKVKQFSKGINGFLAPIKKRKKQKK